MKKVLLALVVLSLCSVPAMAQRQHQGGGNSGARQSQAQPRAQQSAPRQQAQPAQRPQQSAPRQQQQQAQPRAQQQAQRPPLLLPYAIPRGTAQTQPFNRGGRRSPQLYQQQRPYGPQYQARPGYRSPYRSGYRAPYFYRSGPRVWWSDNTYWYPYSGASIYYDSYYDDAAHIKFDGVPDETVITVDGFARGQVGDVHGWGKNLKLTPGEHTVVLQVPGQAPVEFRVQLDAGESVTLRLPRD